MSHSLNPGPPLPGSLDTSIQKEQVQLLYRGMPLSLISSLIIALILSVAHLPVIGQAEIILWNLLLGGTLALRLILWQFWLNASHLYSVARWLFYFRIGVCLAGAAWGSAASIIYAQNNATYQALLSFCLAGVVSGSLTSLSSDRFSALGFALLAVCPLTLRILMENDPTALAMSVMTILFIIFVVSSSGRTAKELRSQIQQNESLMNLSQELQYSHEIDKIVSKAQTQFISNNNHREILQHIIDNTINLTKSKMGFIGQIQQDQNNKPYMSIQVFNYDKKINKSEFFDRKLKENISFHNLNGLFGSLMQKGKPVYSNNPRQDIRSIGLPSQHPDISRFVGLPIFNGKDLVAMIGLANADEDYPSTIEETLEPITSLIAQFFHTQKLQHQHNKNLNLLKETTEQTQTILDDIADGIFMLNSFGLIQSANKSAETMFGYKSDQIINKIFFDLLAEPWRTGCAQQVQAFNSQKNPTLKISNEMLAIRRNGKWFPVDFLLSSISRNNEIKLIVIIRDISEKTLIEEKTKKLMQNISREIFLPNHAINIALQLLKNDTNNKDLIIDNIVNHARQLSSTIEKLLNTQYSHLQTNKQPQILASELIEKTINNYRYIAEFRHTTFVFENNLYTENISVDSLIFEVAFANFLELAANSHGDYKEIKIYAEQNKGNIRIYFIDKQEMITDVHLSSKEIEKIQLILDKIDSKLGIETVTNSFSKNQIIYIDFPIAISKVSY